MSKLVLYHRTNIAEARRIVKEGFRDQKWGFQLEGPGEERRLKVLGVWLTDRPPAVEQGPPGDAVLEVTVEGTDQQLAPFEVHGALGDTRLWVIPAQVLNPLAEVRFGSVDPRSSWFHQAPETE